jgi:hypothetical protein
VIGVNTIDQDENSTHIDEYLLQARAMLQERNNIIRITVNCAFHDQMKFFQIPKKELHLPQFSSNKLWRQALNM